MSKTTTKTPPKAKKAPATPRTTKKSPAATTPPAGGILADFRKAVADAEAAGMTRYKIAKAAGIDQSRITRIMNNQTPNIENAERIAAVLGLKFTLQKILA